MPQFKSGWCLQCPKGVSLWDFYFYLFLYFYSLSRHTCAGIFCFYLESGEVLRKKMDGSVLVSPRWEVANKKKRYQGKSLIPFGAEGETRQGAALSVRCANDPIVCPFLLRKKMDGSVLVSPGWEVATKRKDTKEKTSVSFGAEGETRTLAPVARPTPLAGAPRHQLEYFCILCCNLCETAVKFYHQRAMLLV